jgi:L-alanine-DL-glutamate epimerase-like enolase superfamily enzyme
MWANRPQVKNGWMEVSREPGFDIQLDPAMLQRYRLNKS